MGFGGWRWSCSGSDGGCRLRTSLSTKHSPTSNQWDRSLSLRYTPKSLGEPRGFPFPLSFSLSLSTLFSPSLFIFPSLSFSLVSIAVSHSLSLSSTPAQIFFSTPDPFHSPSTLHPPLFLYPHRVACRVISDESRTMAGSRVCGS